MKTVEECNEVKTKEEYVEFNEEVVIVGGLPYPSFSYGGIPRLTILQDLIENA